LINQSRQEQPASDEIFKDTTDSEGSDPRISPAGIAEEEAFVLKDYAPDFVSTDEAASSSGGSVKPQLFEQPDVQQEVDEQPLMTESVQGSSVSMDDVLDSIRESISMSESPDEEQPTAGGEPVSLEEDFIFFDSFDKDTSTDSPSENTADESAKISWGYDEAAAAVDMPDAPKRKRSSVLMIALIVVLLVVGGYYLFTVTSDDEQPLVRGTFEAVVTAEPVIEDEVGLVEPSPEAESEIPAVIDESESVASSEAALPGEGEAVKPSTELEPETPVAPEEAESIVSAETVVAGEGDAVKPSIEAESEAPVATEEAESVVSADVIVFGEGEAVKPSVEAEPEAPVVPEEVESIVSAETVAAGEGDAAKPSIEAESEAPVVPDEAESVVSADVIVFGEGAVAKPSAEAELAAPVASESTEAVVPVKSKPVTAPFFTVHVGSYRKRASAASEVARIKAKGYDAFIERVDLGKKGVWYRVKVGRFKIRAEAEQLQEKIKKIPVIDSMVVTQRTN
jgi:cell division protein FtsN